jgi:hypothetical protein
MEIFTTMHCITEGLDISNPLHYMDSYIAWNMLKLIAFNTVGFHDLIFVCIKMTWVIIYHSNITVDTCCTESNYV